MTRGGGESEEHLDELPALPLKVVLVVLVVESS